MLLTYILSFFTLCTLAFAEYEEAIIIDDSKFGPLQPPDSPKKSTVQPQVTNYSNIQTISNSIINLQKRLEDEYNYLPPMQPYLWTTTIPGKKKNRRKLLKLSLLLSSFLYADIFTGDTNTTQVTQPSTNKPLANVIFDDNLGVANCISFMPINQTEVLNRTIKVVDSVQLGNVLKSDPKVLNPSMAAVCSLVLFYAVLCPFSTLASPHFHVLSEVFPQIKMVAFSSVSDQNYNNMYGITGVPSLLLFHNGKFFAKYEGSDYTLYEFTKFVDRHTNLIPNDKIEISVNNFVKPVSVFGNNNYSLWCAWFVIIFWMLYFGYIRIMNFWSQLVEDIKKIWRVSEAQHEHTD